MKKDLVSKGVKDTDKIARDFFREILKTKTTKATVVGLSGELGAGKTAFTQAMAKMFGIKNKVNSPTFVIMKRYPLKKNKKNNNYKFLFHLDAYRLKNEKELLHLGWEEIIADKENLVFIEWPENVAKIMPKDSHSIKISHTKEGNRSFKIKSS